MSRRRQLLASWLPVGLYMAAIWMLSSFDLGGTPVEHVPFRDKGIHFIEYAGLGLLVVHASLRTWPDRGLLRAAGAGLLIAVGWGLLDELHQALVPGRDADVLDAAADALGASAGGGARVAVGLVRRATVGPRREPPTAGGTSSGAGEVPGAEEEP